MFNNSNPLIAMQSKKPSIKSKTTKIRNTEGKLKKERAMAMATQKTAMPMKQTSTRPNQVVAKSTRETKISKLPGMPGVKAPKMLPNKKTTKSKMKMF